MDTPTRITSVHSSRDTASRDQAYALGRELQALAAAQASLDHDFCMLVDQFDAADAITYFHGMKTTAHYLAWACSMNGTAAREHVRVARALREMPQTKELFRQGRFSYSKVREITRLVGEVDESGLCRLALEMTASQLARTVPTFRLHAGSRIRALPERSYSSRPTGGGMVRISVVLPAEQAALVDAAIEAATRVLPDDEPPTVEDLEDETEPRRRPRQIRPPDRVQALVDLAATYLDVLPGEPADDHTLVIVHVSAESLADSARIPDGLTSDVPAGTSLDSGTCHVEGHGPIEPATAERLLCTAKVQGVLVRGGKVLDLGRTHRLASRAQRRALKVRDRGICQFPGCSTTTHLDAHHVRPWSHGGSTDLDNLILICGRHHTLVHEGGLRILAARPTATRRWEFTLADGRRIDPDGYIGWRHADSIAVVLEALSTGHTDDDPTRIFPRHAGEGFSLDECVRVLFDIAIEQSVSAAA